MNGSLQLSSSSRSINRAPISALAVLSQRNRSEPYHAFGKVKYDNLGLVYEPELRGVTPPSQERMEQLQAQFEQMGVQIVHT
ncbi:hypothetical protein [uncultured Oscillibacter sp.]|uniref:hypothetical protein n=1 Tax=uncultured Oscillibacter sp. TaxID=876091 RepID=UPI00280419F8|nr:hypothetical protein [uncultured Oscillibacter sp.]